MRIGIGEDIHRLIKDRKLLLGGVEIPADLGEDAHSDGDVLLHALADAIYGSIAEKDIGWHFPNDRIETENIDSRIIVEDAMSLAKQKGYKIASFDSNVFLENIKLKPYIDDIRRSLSLILGIDVAFISVKAKTSEGLGPIGEGKAIKASVIVLLEEEKDD